MSNQAKFFNNLTGKFEYIQEGGSASNQVKWFNNLTGEWEYVPAGDIVPNTIRRGTAPGNRPVVPREDDRGNVSIDERIIPVFERDVPSNRSPVPRRTVPGKHSVPQRTAWSDADTQSINELAGTNLTTQERVQIGRTMFGNAYRGTESQNNLLAQNLFRMNKPTSNEPRAFKSVEDAMFGSDNNTQPSPTEQSRGRGRFWFSGNRQPI